MYSGTVGHSRHLTHYEAVSGRVKAAAGIGHSGAQHAVCPSESEAAEEADYELTEIQGVR